jgi:hypothetical protein
VKIEIERFAGAGVALPAPKTSPPSALAAGKGAEHHRASLFAHHHSTSRFAVVYCCMMHLKMFLLNALFSLRQRSPIDIRSVPRP